MATPPKPEAKLIVPPVAGAEPPKAEPKTLTAADLAGVPAPKVVPVDVPEWGGRVFVKEFTAGDRDRFDVSLRGKDDAIDYANYRAKLLAVTLCDEGGKLLFPAGGVEKIAALPAGPVTRVFLAARDLNKLGAEAVADAKKD